LDHCGSGTVKTPVNPGRLNTHPALALLLAGIDAVTLNRERRQDVTAMKLKMNY
jgi:hypothetical protein